MIEKMFLMESSKNIVTIIIYKVVAVLISMFIANLFTKVSDYI